MLRGSGVPRDSRIIEPYDCYDIFKSSIPVGVRGDCHDRYLVRLEEMRESLKIMTQCLDYSVILAKEDDNSYIIEDSKVVPPLRAL